MSLQYVHRARTARRERGSSLVLVLLISIIALGVVYFTVALTYDHFQRTKLERDATIAALDAQEVFDCIRYWVNLDPNYFTDGDMVNNSGTYTYEVWVGESQQPDGTGVGTSSVCLQTTLDFKTSPNGETYVEGTDFATSTFTIGNLTAVIVRNKTSTSAFDGKITVYSRTAQGDAPYVSERYQRHWYRVGISGADIMFVIDRSGSIGGRRTDPPSSTNEWRQLMLAVTETVTEFDIPYDIRFGVVTFSDGAVTDMGTVVPPDANCPDPLVSCLLEPDIPLTDVSAQLPSAGTLPNNPIDDTWGAIRTGAGYTNISIGLAMAGAELLGKYYPAGTQSQWADFIAAGKEALIPGRGAGWFEHAMANGIDLESTLVDKLSIDADNGDRFDGTWPDYIFLVTDGEPNKVPNATSTTGTAGDPAQLDAGDPCFHASSTYPATIGFTTALYGVEGDLSEKCNATLVKRILNTYGIQFGVIGVGVNTQTEAWLSDTMADLPYVRADSYADLQQAIAQLFGGLALLEYR